MSALAPHALQADGPGPAPAPLSEGSFARLAAALREHVHRVVAVPGAPVDLLTDELADGLLVEAGDERSGFDQALGLAIAGLPAATVFTGAGLGHTWDAIADALATGTGTGDGGPVLVIAADEGGIRPGDLDSRAMAAAIDLAVLEPCTLGQVTVTVRLAAELSSTAGEPVMVRYTPAHLAFTAADDPADRAVSDKPEPVARVVPLPGRRARTGAGPAVPRDRLSLPLLRALVDGAAVLDEHRGHRVLPDLGRTAVIGFGAAWSTTARPVARELDVHGLGSSVVFPLPGAVVDYASLFDTVLVVEDGRPVGETALTLALHDLGARTAVLGRRRGALPAAGPLGPDDVRRALAGAPASDRPQHTDRHIAHAGAGSGDAVRVAAVGTCQTGGESHNRQTGEERNP